MGRSAILLLVQLLGLGSARDSSHQESTPSVFGPVFIAPVGNQTAAMGKEAVFSCSVGNIGKYKVGWLRGSDQTVLSLGKKTLIQNARYAVTYEPGGSSATIGNSGNYGVTGSSQEDVINGTWKLHIRHLKETDKGCYMCQVNTDPMTAQVGCLDILVPPDIVDGDVTSTDLSVQEGENATLSCNATGRPAPRISWKREDSKKILIRTVGGWKEYDLYNGSSLQFHRVERQQMGTYLCIASNDVPPAVSRRVTLAVNFEPVVQAVNQLLGAPPGSDVKLQCFVEAHPNTINYWTKNSSDMLPEGKKYEVRERREGYKVWMSLIIKHFTVDDVGNYRCISTNSIGSVERSIRLYEITMSGNDGLLGHGKNHASIIGGLAEAARGSGSSGRNFRDTKLYALVFYTISLIIPLFELRPR